MFVGFPIIKDCWFYMRSAHQLEHTDSVIESSELSATASVDDGLRAALTSEDGFMRAGAMPSVPTATAAGCTKLFAAVAKVWELPSARKVIHGQ